MGYDARVVVLDEKGDQTPPQALSCCYKLFSVHRCCAITIGLAGIYLYLDPQTHGRYLRRPQRQASNNHSEFIQQMALNIAEFGERRLIPDKTCPSAGSLFINALLDTEDKRFYEHQGIDFISLSNDILQLLGSLMGQDNSVGGALAPSQCNWHAMYLLR